MISENAFVFVLFARFSVLIKFHETPISLLRENGKKGTITYTVFAEKCQCMNIEEDKQHE